MGEKPEPVAQDSSEEVVLVEVGSVGHEDMVEVQAGLESGQSHVFDYSPW